MSYYSEMKKGKHSGEFTPVEYAIWLCGTAPSANDRILESAAKELAELRKELAEYKKLYNDVAAELNTANYNLSQINQLASRKSGLTQLAGDWATVAVCPLCKLDYDTEQKMCISCGRPTPKA